MSESIGTAKAEIKVIEEAILILTGVKATYGANSYITDMVDKCHDDLAADLHTMREELEQAEEAGYE